MKKILFLNSFSDHAPQTYRYALKIAEHFQASLTSLHVFEIPDSAMMENQVFNELTMSHNLDNYIKDRSREELARLRKFEHQNLIPALQKVHQERKVLGGDLVSMTLKAAHQIQADLIVMGLHQHNRFISGFRNDITKLLDHAHVPILLVPPNRAYSGFLNILYPTKLVNGEEVKALSYLQTWADAFHARIHALPLVDQQLEWSTAKETIERIKRAANGNGQAIHWLDTFNQTPKLSGNPVKTILQYADQVNADVIALKLHHYSFWDALLGRHTEDQISQRAGCPILLGRWK